MVFENVTYIDMAMWVLSTLGVVLGGFVTVKHNAVKLGMDIDGDGDVDNDDARKILSMADTARLAKVFEILASLDAKYGDAIYNVGKMREDDAEKFLCAMFQIASVPVEDRDALLRAVLDGNMKDIDFILESTDVPKLRALSEIIKQLRTTSFLTGKDPTPEMKEKMYQAFILAVSTDEGSLQAMKELFV